jgi:6-phospho-3-hexuloisomerase
MRELRRQILDELEASFASVNEEQAQRLMEALLAAKRIFVGGRGRTGLVMQAFSMRLMHLGFQVAIVGETLAPNITSADLLIAGSGSGETRFTNLAADIAQGVGAKIACITARPDSRLARKANLVVTLSGQTFRAPSADAPVSVQPPGSLFEQGLWLLLDTVVLMLMQHMGITTEQLLARHANIE